MNLPRLVPVIVATLLFSSSAIHAAEQASCVFETFAPPTGYSFSQVNGVSDDGIVVGQLVNSSTEEFVAFSRSAHGVITKYSAPKSAMTWLYGQNGTGTNAGFYQDAAYPGHIHGFTLQGSDFSPVNYPKATNTWLFEVNQVGDSVGSFSTSPSLVKGFKLVNGTYTAIVYPGAQSTYPMAINSGGEVVGTYSTSTISYGFIWENGKFTTVNFPKAAYGTVLTGVNNSGVIVGNRITSDNDFGFIYEDGVFKNIVYPGAKSQMAGGINNNGLISGQIYVTGQGTLGYTAVCK